MVLSPTPRSGLTYRRPLQYTTVLDAQQMPQGQPLDGVHVLNPGRQGDLLEGEEPSLLLPAIGPSASARQQTGTACLVYHCVCCDPDGIGT